jgi:hypothetical protein
MKSVLGFLLRENVDDKYDPHKFSTQALPRAGGRPPKTPGPAVPSEDAYPSRSAPAPPPTYAAPSDGSSYRPQPPPSRLYGDQAGGQPSRQPSAPPAPPEPSPLGCWLVSQPGVTWPVRQELKQDTLPLSAKVQISAAPAPVGCQGTLAAYEAETFMNPVETTPAVISTGSLVNTYTGEVLDLYEDAMPPPDNKRDPGDAERERKQAQRRLLAAEGNVLDKHRKREQQNPLQPGDAGPSMQLATFRLQSDVAAESQERANRDLYFSSRNELVPTEMQQTRNPFGYEGFNNRIRINPYLLPTQVLDDKGWIANATLLPGGDERPKDLKTRLRKEWQRTDYLGQVAPPPHLLIDGKGPPVRRSQAARDEEGLVGEARGIYGDAPSALASSKVRVATKDRAPAPVRSVDGSRASALASSEVRLATKDRAPAPVRSFDGVGGSAAVPVSAAEVLSSIEGHRGNGGDAIRLLDQQSHAGPAPAGEHRSGRSQDEMSRPRVGQDLQSTSLGAPAVSSLQQHKGARREAVVDARSLLSTLPQCEASGGPLQTAQANEPSKTSLPLHTALAGAGIDASRVEARELVLKTNGELEPLQVSRNLSLEGSGAPVSASQASGPSRLEAKGRERLGYANVSLHGPSSGASVGEARVPLRAPATDLDRRGPASEQEKHAHGVGASSSWIGRKRTPTERPSGDREQLTDLSSRSAGYVATQGTQGALKRDALPGQRQGAVGGCDDRGHSAADSQQVRLRREASTQGGQSSTPHLDGGFLERNSRVGVRNARGRSLSVLRDGCQVGGDADYQKKASMPLRETRPELVTPPEVRRSAALAGERTSLAHAREARRTRPAKSPFRSHALKERAGLARSLTEVLDSRCEDSEG